MSEMERIGDQLKRAFEGPAWHGPAVLEVLDGVTVARAAARPIPSAHGIWEITLHMATWKRVVKQRLLGKQVEVTDEEDWPRVADTGGTAWAAAVEALKAEHRDLMRVVAEAPESRLAEPLVPGGNTGYVQLHGVVQHDLYHAGQIAVLKRAAR